MGVFDTQMVVYRYHAELDKVRYVAWEERYLVC